MGRYEVSATQSITGEVFQYIQLSSLTNYVISNLLPNIGYAVSVRPVTSGFENQAIWSDSVSVTTLNAGKYYNCVRDTGRLAGYSFWGYILYMFNVASFISNFISYSA